VIDEAHEQPFEDVIFITEDGAQNMTRWSGTPEEPAVV
jgi:hypothetical protein